MSENDEEVKMLYETKKREKFMKSGFSIALKVRASFQCIAHYVTLCIHTLALLQLSR
jgi:hypothetical protein